MKNRVMLAYSGGLDTSVILKWLIEKNYEVVCFVANVGQEENFYEVEQKALAIGAKQVLIEDCCEEFVESYIFPSIQAHAMYEGRYLLGTSLARPLIAKKLVQAAKKEKISILAHGATGKGNDQVRFELAFLQLMPNAEIVAPWKDPEFLAEFQGRPDLLAYAAKHAIPVTSTIEKPYSIDENLMHTSFEGGLLEDPSQAPPAKMFKKTVSPFDAPDEPTKLSIDFVQGVPVHMVADKAVLGSLNLFHELNRLGGLHGIGRIDIVESRFVGMKSRGVYETPAGTILLQAHRDLELLTLDREVILLKESLAPKIAQLIYNGFWFSPEKEMLMGTVASTQKNVTGTVFLTLYKGNVIIEGRTSPHSLYRPDIASMDQTGRYDQTDAKGFIKINALRLI